jgi:hypothetical protein
MARYSIILPKQCIVRAVQTYDRSILNTRTESEEQECKLKKTILLDTLLEM